MRALQSSSQDCWPGFSDPGPGPADHHEDQEDYEDERDEDEKDGSNGEGDSDDMTMMMTLRIIDNSYLVLLGLFSKDAHYLCLEKGISRLFDFSLV